MKPSVFYSAVLSDGTEIIFLFLEYEDQKVKIINPLTINRIMGSDGRINAYMDFWMFSTESTAINISEKHIISIARPTEEFLNIYHENLNKLYNVQHDTSSLNYNVHNGTNSIN